MTKDEAFLEWYKNAHWGNEDLKECCHRSWNAAIKQARSAQAQEPVAFNAGVPPLYPEMKDGETISVEYTTPPAAQQALDKKAENARELGLDYEPVWGGGPSNKDYEDAMRLRRLNELAKPAQQQEPVAWRFTGIAGLKRYMTQKQYDAQQPGVKKWYEPFMCANCTSLLAQRKPLTDDEIHQCFLASEQGQDGTEFRKAFARAIEAKLEEKNT